MAKKIIFISLFFLSLSSLATASEESFSCYGYEPFWTADISDESINVEMIGSDEKNIKVQNVRGAFGYQEVFIKVYSNFYGPAAIVKRSKCDESPADEDKAKAHEVFLFTDLGTLYGCCDLKK